LEIPTSEREAAQHPAASVTPAVVAAVAGPVRPDPDPDPDLDRGGGGGGLINGIYRERLPNSTVIMGFSNLGLYITVVNPRQGFLIILSKENLWNNSLSPIYCTFAEYIFKASPSCGQGWDNSIIMLNAYQVQPTYADNGSIVFSVTNSPKAKIFYLFYQ
jgi:hypothetical protein